MTIENWKFWLIPFAAWMIVMAWYSGYQSGYQEGHETAWAMSRPTTRMPAEDLALTQAAEGLGGIVISK